MNKKLEDRRPKYISIKQAKTHNLKNVDVDIPAQSLTVITGISGSGKSSLAFDTLFAEGQRRYVESLSTYARQFVSLMEKPDVESITGLSPAIAIEQKSGMHNPRSTVGTVTEIYDYMRLMFARIGVAHCPEHNTALKAQNVSQIVQKIFTLPAETKIMVLAPLLKGKKGEQRALLNSLQRQGYIRVILNEELIELDTLEQLPSNQKNNLSVVVDRLKIKEDNRQRLAESLETALELADGTTSILQINTSTDNEPWLFSIKLACKICGYSSPTLSPRNFSFNSPEGACQDCDGIGHRQIFDVERIIPDPELSIANGAIKGWDKPQSYYYQLLVGLAEFYQFSLNTPWNKLTSNIQKIILHGSNRKKIPYTAMGIQARFSINDRVFEGVLKNFERRYRETDSDIVRSEISQYLSTLPCPTCDGSRLGTVARNVRIHSFNIADLVSMSVKKLYQTLDNIKLTKQDSSIAEPILKEITSRLRFLISVGLDYLSLGRRAETLSGGEAQRIRLASQIGSGLTGVMYILDEPSIGLHQRDNQRLINTLFTLRDLGNSVVVVEHDEDTMLQADHIIDVGPGAGKHGGKIIASCSPQELEHHKTSTTGKFLFGKKRIPVPKKRKKAEQKKYLCIKGVSTNNLQDVSIDIPIGLLTVITGVSGSGKSSLINHTLYPAVHNRLERYDKIRCEGSYKDIEGTQFIDKIIRIDQSPIGRTPRSNPATYTGMFNLIRELFAQVPEARSRGYTPGRFSFNVKGGRCESCQGDGVIKVEMHFLADVYVMCDTCQGKRYNHETLQVLYKGYSIDEVLHMSVAEAAQFFKAIPGIAKKLDTLLAVGLGYMQLGQSATTLSGGEAQRLKLSRELAKRNTGRTLYILDEPTTGLHFQDVQQLLEVLLELRNQGNTVIVIEHNLDIIKTADWVIDIGPEGGDLGGKLVASGTPEKVSKVGDSYTGQFLQDSLSKASTINES
ncbi:MAG: excinuclease ABC subunit UvrA [Pseudomonadota bacterium]|nr:excinuclease ABC subunit UvrA [Pseudomonadota bacterium]